MTSATLAGRPSALVVGHPGHELRVWGWMQAARPLVAVITDGGGHGHQSRLPLSRDLCRAAKAPVSRCFGMVTDAAMCAAILEQDFPFFRGLADDLASVLVAERIDCVAGDAHEGYNPTHDLCRAIVNRAVRTALAADRDALTVQLETTSRALTARLDTTERALTAIQQSRTWRFFGGYRRARAEGRR